eukprot:GILK01011861.1.p1 GENE.GILK01011861.1~~GILK01011861.1.p1  ORF type:complete len:548 (+),score=58.20 GILK01011861.1:280-1923(+)
MLCCGSYRWAPRCWFVATLLLCLIVQTQQQQRKEKEEGMCSGLRLLKQRQLDNVQSAISKASQETNRKQALRLLKMTLKELTKSLDAVAECPTAAANLYLKLATLYVGLGRLDLVLVCLQHSIIFTVPDFQRFGELRQKTDPQWPMDLYGAVGELTRLKQRTMHCRRDEERFYSPLAVEAHASLTATTAELQVAIVSICQYDPNQTLLAHYSILNKHAYGRVHKVGVFIHTTASDRSRPPAWSKIQLVRDTLATGSWHWVMWMDCDSYFMNMKVSPTDILLSVLDNHLDHTSADIDVIVSEDGLMLNTGVFFVRNGTRSVSFLDYLYSDRYSSFINHPWWEQGPFLHALFEKELTGSAGILPDMARHTVWLPQAALNSYPDSIAAKMPTHHEYVTGEYILSFSGCKTYFTGADCNALFHRYYRTAELVNTDILKSVRGAIRISSPLNDTVVSDSRLFLAFHIESFVLGVEGSLCLDVFQLGNKLGSLDKGTRVSYECFETLEEVSMQLGRQGNLFIEAQLVNLLQEIVALDFVRVMLNHSRLTTTPN